MSDSKIALSAVFGVKAGMTRVFDENGNHVPVTVIKIIPNLITQVKTTDKDGYNAYQVGYGEKREALLNKPNKGILAKAGVSQNVTHFSEIKSDSVEASNLGKEVDFETFGPGTYVDVTGESKGKGFAGVMKRYNFRGGPASHGSHFHRRVGSIGNRATPGRVFRGKKMPGHMGVDQKTVQNMVVFEINLAKGYLLLRGSVPGGKEGFIKISKAIKKQ
ncbi:MAG: 50S ribosomal protein L3 [Alphaproteobacteria bacterium]|nr:MAG: 50S ribosomal protein L3 [Alphaproteobacteria bacterium]